MAAPISIVIPSRNSGRTIDACLQSVVKCGPADLRDVIVVDNGSTDDTVATIGRYPVRLEALPPGFVSASRNAGARLAKHAIVAFVDSDCVVHDGWYAAIGDALTDPAAGVVGCRHDAPEHGTWVQRAWNLAHSRGAHATGVKDVPYLPAGNMALRAAVFSEARGFDETLETGEDPDLCARVAAQGLRILEVRAMRCTHFGEPATLGAVFRRERWHGRGTRFRYGDGRLAPIMLTSLTFGALAIVTVAAAGAAVAGARWWWPVASLALALGVPTVYAVRYARHPAHATQLWLIYVAYFFGRAAALGVVLRRAWERRHEPHVKPERGAPRRVQRGLERSGLSMIEVLHLIDTYRIGGPGKTIINSARFIDRTRYRVHVAGFTHPDASRNEFAAAVRAAGIPFLELPETRRFDAQHVRMLRTYLREQRIGILHAHGYRSDVLAFIATRGMPRVRLVTTHHGWIRNSMRQQVVVHAALLLSSLFDGLEVVSRPLRDELPRWLRDSPRVAIVPNAIVLDDYRPLGVRDTVRARFGVARSDTLLAVIGRMSAEKGCVDMIEAFRAVAGTLAGCHLLFVGEGPLEPEIRRRAANANLADRTHFAGHQTDVRPFYEAADIIVSPSHTEGISNVILEAMTSGTPVVATRVGGNAEIIEAGRSGLLVEPRQLQQLAKAIVRLAEDQNLKALLVAGALERVQGNFAFERRMAVEERFYERVLGGGRGATEL